MYCIVLIGPTGGGRDSLRWGLLGPPPRRGPQGQGPVYTSHPSAPIEASQASWNSTSRFLVPTGTGHPHNLGTAQRRERRGWCGTWDEKMTWGNTMTKAKTAPMRPKMCRRNQTRENEKPPCSRTNPDEGDDEGKDEAEGESRRRKMKTKTETRRRRISEKPDACLPQANQIRRESRRRCQILRRRIPRN